MGLEIYCRAHVHHSQDEKENSGQGLFFDRRLFSPLRRAALARTATTVVAKSAYDHAQTAIN
jgi:hypothetical protein